MHIKELYQLYSQNYLVDTDSRNIRKNTLFFSLRGDSFNGNKFAKEALDSGARYAVIDEEKYEIKGATILVEDVLKTLQELSNYHRKKLAIPVIGLTGSNGKTTTKELIKAVLSTHYTTSATLGNLNNHIGVPLTLLSFTNKTEIGVVEMGANHQKEIEFLSSICEPDIGYITNFGKAHLEGFRGIQGVIKGKSELYAHLKERRKIALVNPDDPKQLELTEGSERILVNNSITISSSQPFLRVNYNRLTIQTHLAGVYNLSNIRAAISIGEYFNVSEKNIAAALRNYIPTDSRSQIIVRKENKIMMDAYNANPTSTSLALESFSLIDHEYKIGILGDMFELGEDSANEHQRIVSFSRELRINRLIFVGENYFKTDAKEKYADFNSLLKQLASEPLKNSFILIKGSRKMALERLINSIN